MKKFYSFMFAALAAGSVFASAPSVTQVDYFKTGRIAPSELQYAEATSQNIHKAPVAKEASASIVGNTYVTLYTDMSSTNMNGTVTIAEGENGGIVLKGFAEGYDVNATYDAETGTITIKTGYVFATHSTYGDITLYCLPEDDPGKYSNGDIIGTIEGDNIKFTNGVYTTFTYGGKNYYMTFMEHIQALKPNGTFSCTQTAQTGDVNSLSTPILVTKTAEDKVEVVGISGLVYGYTYPVSISFEKDATSVTIPFGTEVDFYPSSSVNKPLVIAGWGSNGLVDFTMNVATTEDTTTLTGTTSMGYVYNKSGNSYSGMKLDNPVIAVDYNIFTAPVEGAPVESEVTVDDINYLINAETKTAQVTGCAETLTTVNIPSSITVEEVAYSVATIGDGAFEDNTVITSVSMPVTTVSIGDSAFANCTGLTLIVSNATEVPVTSATAFTGVDKTISVEVPEASVEAYKADDVWKEFTKIVPLGTSAITSVGVESNVKTEYYSLQGVRVSAPQTGEVYIIRTADKASKVLVK